MQDKGVMEWTKLTEHLPPARQLPCSVRHISVQAKYSLPPLVAPSLEGLWGRFLCLFSVSLSLLSLLVWIDLQEPRCYLWAIPRVPSRESPKGKSLGCSRESLSFPAWGVWCLSHMVLRGHLSLSGRTVGAVSYSVPLVTWRDHWGKGTPFCQPVTLRTPIHSMAYRLIMASDISWDPPSDSPLASSGTRKIWPWKISKGKGLAPI